jgi:hypothetical protein
MKKVSMAVLSSVLLVCTGAGAEIYKCSDAQGKIRYGDQPCAGDAVIITPRAAPAVSADMAGRMDKTQRLLRAYATEHEERLRAEAEQHAAQEQRKHNCARAQAYERGVTRASRVYRTDEAGQRTDLSFEERAAAEAKARAEVTHWCGSK